MANLIERIQEIDNSWVKNINTIEFSKGVFEDDNILESENLTPSHVASVVNRLALRLNGMSQRNAFAKGVYGFLIKRKCLELSNNDELAELRWINYLNEKNIMKACKLCSYDIWVDNYSYAKNRNPEYIEPSKSTIRNIEIMTKRAMDFLEMNGPVKRVGFDFKEGYTNKLSSLTGEYLTEKTLWIIRTSMYEPTLLDKLEIVIQYIMAKRSEDEQLEKVTQFGIYNPRKNICYVVDTEHYYHDFYLKNILASIKKKILF